MEKDGLNKSLYRVCSAYVAGMSILFVLAQILLWMDYASGQYLREYCIHVPVDQPHHIRVNADNACLIDWWYFFREPVFISALIYAVFIGPAALAGYVFQRRLGKADRHV